MFDLIVTNLPIVICVLVGLGLLILEMFMPGFGVPGISGIALLILGAVLVWVKAGALAALGMVVVIVALVAIVLSITLKSAASGKLSKSPLILNDAEKKTEGFSSTADLSVFLGKEGTACTVLRPSGIAEFEGVRLNVVTDGGFLPQGAKVSIQRVEGGRIVVRALKG